MTTMHIPRPRLTVTARRRGIRAVERPGESGDRGRAGWVVDVKIRSTRSVEGRLDAMANDGRLTALAQAMAIEAGADWPSLDGDAQDTWHERAIERVRGTDNTAPPRGES